MSAPPPQRYVCIHGHFYQPPRESPWLEEIEVQDSAYPYHDWNERVTAECYAPNAAARILDDRNRIVEIANNYFRISFNFGPTLLSWLEAKSPDVYRAVLAADHASRGRFSGHGSAIAQVYNHMILPLANERDQRTQVIWGIRDFERRYGRSPEGMWLPETAADLQSLDVLASFGVRFTILAPSQAARWRLPGEPWTEVTGDAIDTSVAYRVALSSGRSITVFFYDGAVSQAVAFEGLLRNGGDFAARLLAGLRSEEPGPRLVHIATDGETYGHHHRYGEMALAYALSVIESGGSARLTNYGEYLERFPPVREAQIRERTSWSCVHGVERWRSNCGCSSGTHPGWQQAWRGPLRQALDELRDAIAAPFERLAGGLLRDPWAARDDYVSVVLDRSPESRDRFLAQHAAGALTPADGVTALKLLEMQRHAMLAYTSCGWFFDEISGIETVQVLAYAGRVLQLAGELFADPAAEGRFLETLARAPSNVPAYRDGRGVYEHFVRPAIVDLPDLAAHYAVRSLFTGYGASARIFSYDVEREEGRALEAGPMKLLVGRSLFSSRITGESARLAYGALHLGDQNVTGGVREPLAPAAEEEIIIGLSAAFLRTDLPDVLRRLDAGFGRSISSLKQLFRDEQRQILGLILDSTLEEAEGVLRQIHDRHAPLLRFLADLGSPLPPVFRATAEFVVNASLRRALAAEPPDWERAEGLRLEAEREKIPLDAATLEFTLRRQLERLADRLTTRADDPALLGALDAGVELSRRLPFRVDLWRVQNSYYATLRAFPAASLAQTGEASPAGGGSLAKFLALGEKLSVRVPPVLSNVAASGIGIA